MNMETALIRLLRADEIECRIVTINEKGLSLLLFKDTRVDQKILDETFTPMGWRRTHQEIGGNLYCTVEIRDEGKQQWIAKQDVGTESYSEKEKGQASDSFKRACFNWGIGRELYIEATELLLNIILGRNDMVVTQVVGQREIKNQNGRSVRLDIHAVDSDDKQYDIEVQREDRGAGAQRARFNSSMLDTRMLKPGEKFAKLAEGYVIFITENDVLGKDISLYHIDRVIKETNELFGDGSHIIYVNGAYKNDEEPIGKLMHNFRCVDADDMNYSVLADRVRYFKESEGGIETMCRVMEEMRDKAAAEADYKAMMREKRLFAVSLWEDGIRDIEKIAKLTRLTVEEARRQLALNLLDSFL